MIDGRDGLYRRNRVHLHPTTPETSPDKSSSPASLASALNSHKLLEHVITEKLQDANRLNKSQADSPTRHQRIRKEPDWFKDYEFKF